MNERDHAVVLAAGRGRRLRPLTDDTPKTLLEVGRLPILGHILRALDADGYRTVTMVTGYRDEEIRAYCEETADVDLAFEYVHNEDFDTTNNIYSLWLARDHLRDGFTLVNSDTVFPSSFLRSLSTADGSRLVVDCEKDLGDEEMCVAIEDGRITAIGKDLADPDGEYIGVCKFTADCADRLVDHLDAFIDDGRVDEWYEAVFAHLFDEREVGYVEASNPWIEIDDADDLETARDRWEAMTNAGTYAD
ncbi:phosphocholine cytidylyltransferase family protein [Halomarina ordinaria]|uniref:Phosphocholine cytidylyltransferase family protein n=1 Tax=Halomarina ordinaria TaxID=3033939 RepID=A0ABD5UA90_9EURY|nr:phosphocholine cytidylyltransferase family protein [Halomarina sp. PSRA2]